MMIRWKLSKTRRTIVTASFTDGFSLIRTLERTMRTWVCLVAIASVIEASVPSWPHTYWDIPGDYCRAKYPSRQCCQGRQDPCNVPILGTLCYCDTFCNRTENADCCPDYFEHCEGLSNYQPMVQKPEEIVRPEGTCGRCAKWPSNVQVDGQTWEKFEWSSWNMTVWVCKWKIRAGRRNNNFATKTMSSFVFCCRSNFIVEINNTRLIWLAPFSNRSISRHGHAKRRSMKLTNICPSIKMWYCIIKMKFLFAEVSCKDGVQHGDGKKSILKFFQNFEIPTVQFCH